MKLLLENWNNYINETLVEEYQLVDASYEDGSPLSEDFEFY